MRSNDRLKLLYLNYQSAYGHYTSQDGDRPWGSPDYKVIERFHHVVLQGHVTNDNHYIFTIRLDMATKLGWIIIYLDELLPAEPHEHVVLRDCVAN